LPLPAANLWVDDWQLASRPTLFTQRKTRPHYAPMTRGISSELHRVAKHLSTENSHAAATAKIDICPHL